jgi:hypothetical protein
MVRELWQTVQRADRLRLRTALAAILLTVLLIKSGTRMKAEILAARSQKTVASDVMLAHVIKYRAQTQWFYAQPVIYAFHARLRIPPELAVVARKRYWSGQMTGHELLSIVQQYKPEQLLLLKGPISPEWTEFLKSNYVLDYDDGQQVLYIAQSLKTVSP